MKLPGEYNKYDHNRYLDKVLCSARGLAEDLPPSPLSVTRGGMQNICFGNLKQIKTMKADLLHLELALEEILQLRDER